MVWVEWLRRHHEMDALGNGADREGCGAAPRGLRYDRQAAGVRELRGLPQHRNTGPTFPRGGSVR